MQVHQFLENTLIKIRNENKLGTNLERVHVLFGIEMGFAIVGTKFNRYKTEFHIQANCMTIY